MIKAMMEGMAITEPMVTLGSQDLVVQRGQLGRKVQLAGRVLLDSEVHLDLRGKRESVD